MNDAPDEAIARVQTQAFSGYDGRRIALLTQHGKERAIAPVLERALGCRVEVARGFDTDRLGTFTRDIPRAGTQLEAARKKARLGMELAGASLGLASEGSFGSDPLIGATPWNVELLVLLDDDHGIELVGVAQGKAVFDHSLVGSWDAACTFARKNAFPSHHLILRPEGENDPRIRKGIDSWAALEGHFARACEEAANGRVFLETDGRAQANPTRMALIGRAAENLVEKVRSRCPACSLPGFWVVERVPGLPCADCGEPTNEIQADVHACVKCPHRERRERTARHVADPAYCPHCNP